MIRRRMLFMVVNGDVEHAAIHPEEEAKMLRIRMGTMLSALTPVFGSYESLSNN